LAFLACGAAAHFGPAACAAPLPDDTWGDGIATYARVPPLAGYVVPATVFRDSYQVALKEVLAAARPMAKEELERYTAAGPLETADGFPLFAFENQRVNVFLWKGRRDNERQQISLRVWNGELWSSKGYGTLEADAVEHLFYHPAEQARCYVLVGQQLGTDRIRTDRVFFGRFPPVEAALREGVKNADAVVYLPRGYGEQAGELLDCLKGDVSRTALRAVPGVERAGEDALVFLKRDGGRWRLASFYSLEFVSFYGDYGQLSLSIPQVREVVAKNAWLKAYVEPPRELRWHLARREAGAPAQAECSLRLTNPGARRGDWLILELAVGKDGPAVLHRLAGDRGGRGGGEPLFRFAVDSGGRAEELTTQGRFGRGAFAAAEPERSPALRCAYRFLDCGPGVVKLALKPEAYPWRAKVTAYCEVVERLFGRPSGESHTSAVTAEVGEPAGLTRGEIRWPSKTPPP
jgi:hypothetical protein